MAEMKLALLPFTVPNFAIGVMPPRQKQDGFVEGPKWKLSDLEPDVLAQLCDDFRAAVFEKAGKNDPSRRVK